MRRTVLITGSTDGIGLEAAALLAARGHRVLLHGRRRERVEAAAARLAAAGAGDVEGFVAALSRPAEVERLAAGVMEAVLARLGVRLPPGP